MTQFYTYWEGNSCPKYIQLCMGSWFRQIPDLELTLINHKNLDNWVGDTYDIDELKKFSLPMQSDAVSAAVLAQHGGTFIDADTILTRNPTEFLEVDDSNRIRCFGNPTTRNFHVAVLRTSLPGNPIAVRWMTEIAKRFDLPRGQVNWDHLGGQILDPLVRNVAYESYIEILDRRATGNILESKFQIGPEAGRPHYEALYFQNNKYEIDDVLSAVTDGIVSLHNSWTPKSYSTISDYDDILSGDLLISKILSHASGSEYGEFVAKNFI